MGQAEEMGTIPKTNIISLLILERKGVPIRPTWPNSPQLSQTTPMDSTFVLVFFLILVLVHVLILIESTSSFCPLVSVIVASSVVKNMDFHGF